MSYAKSLKQSPFKTLTLTIGKLPDGSIWQNAFITQEGAETSLSVGCPAHATKAERKDFLPLVKEALKRAQSIEELTSLLKPPAPLVEPILPEEAGWTAEQEMAAHEPSLAVKLLCILTNSDHQGNPTAAIEAVLNSGLLPEPQLQQWLNRTADRAIRRSLGRSGCPEWETWAAKWLSGEDRTALAAARAADAAALAAADAAALAAADAAAQTAAAREATLTAARAATLTAAARAATLTATLTAAARAATLTAARAAARAAALTAAGSAEERKAQYDDLFNLINKL